MASGDKKFLKHFKLTASMSAEASTAAPATCPKAAPVSRLQPPGSMTKRHRVESMDLETAEVKRQKMAPPGIEVIPPPPVVTSNLNKMKSKSVMNITARAGTAARGRPAAGGAPGRTGAGIGNRTASAASRFNAADRRATTATALNDRTNMGRPTLTRQRTTVGEKTSATSSTTATRKPPAWDIKGRMELMEQKYSETQTRLEALEKEKNALQSDVNIKTEVVMQTSEEIRELRRKFENSEEEVARLKRKLTDTEEEQTAEMNKLKRKLEDAEFNKNSLERKLTALEDELRIKQTEVLGLKTAVAEMTSSRAGLEASLSSTKALLEAANTRVSELTTLTESQTAEMGELRQKLNWQETERRKLHNMIQELKGNIRVFCRVRPLLGEEKEKYSEIKHIVFCNDRALELVKVAESETIAGGLNKSMKYEFEFDQVFTPEATQQDVFREVSQLVQSALDGYNVCVFAYGQTGSGKTFTMEGGQEDREEEAGVILQTIRQIFQEMRRLEEKGWTYSLQASFLEIYNEEIRDLLATEKNLKYDIKMCDSKGSDIYVTNLKVEDVTSEGQISNLLRRARKHRAVAETLCNERSSRSHSVFLLKISGSNSVTTESCTGTLNLVDLAGSERIKDSGSEGQRLTEAQAINKSLSNLGNVIMALAQKSSHVPYRNSKLTHLLQNSLGGNSKTLMFVNVSPKEDCFSETLNSLRFATKVNQCQIGTASKKVK